jgi:hexosaminidase
VLRTSPLRCLAIVLSVAGGTTALAQDVPPLVPWPRSLTQAPGSFDANAPIHLQRGHGVGEADPAVLRLRDVMRTVPGAELLEHAGGQGMSISLALDPAYRDPTGEGYRLVVTPRTISIRARQPAGLFYGVETVRQLVRPDGTIPALTIVDAPRFRWRGMHLDVGRHWFPVDFIKRYVDLMARYKLNTFHWHLTEDQGWRIEIRKYPRLTEVGSCRAETVVRKNFDPYVGDGTPYCGFYTQDEIREVVAYARARHVTVVPEIEMPGHSVAALASYPELGCGPGPYTVWTRWGVNEDIYCPREGTFRFLEGVLDEVLELFPSTFIHIGGDEAPKGTWHRSAEVQQLMYRERLKDESALQSWFIRRIDRYLTARGRRLVGWDEILEGGLAPGATVMSWRGVKGGIEAARAGHDVVMTPTSHLYFDYYQGDPATEPFAIGGSVPLSLVYAYEPIPPGLTAAQARHILGAQGNVWTEYMRTAAQVEYMAFPRMLALAEVVWSPRAARDWTGFQARLPARLAELDQLGVNYRRVR